MRNTTPPLRSPWNQPIARLALLPLLLVALACGGCADPEYDTSTPQRAVDAARKMIDDGRPDLLPRLIHLEAREIEFDDGVTEASAIEDVRIKMGEMLTQLWRVAGKLRSRYPGEVGSEAEGAIRSTAGARFAAPIAGLLTDPGSFLDEQWSRMQIEDLGDGTAAVLIDDEPAFGGTLMMVETRSGWRFAIPIELARSAGFWPDTRHEWAVIASMMLAIENSLKDFERELDRGNFRDLRHASERVGRLIGESVAAQSIIYAMMKRRDRS